MRLKSGQLDKNRDMLGGELNNCPFCYHDRAKEVSRQSKWCHRPSGSGQALWRVTSFLVFATFCRQSIWHPTTQGSAPDTGQPSAFGQTSRHTIWRCRTGRPAVEGVQVVGGSNPLTPVLTGLFQRRQSRNPELQMGRHGCLQPSS